MAAIYLRTRGLHILSRYFWALRGWVLAGARGFVFFFRGCTGRVCLSVGSRRYRLASRYLVRVRARFICFGVRGPTHACLIFTIRGHIWE